MNDETAASGATQRPPDFTQRTAARASRPGAGGAGTRDSEEAGMGRGVVRMIWLCLPFVGNGPMLQWAG